MWKKNKHQGLYDNFNELDKNTPVINKKNNQSDLLNDRYGFYNREITKTNINNNIRKSEKSYSNDDILNNKNTDHNDSIKLINERLNNIDKKIQILNKNIIILNKNLNIAKNKINQNLILETEDLLNISHFANKKMKEQYEKEKTVFGNSNTNLENKNIYNVITNAKNKNDFMKNNNINNDKNLEKNIKNKVENKNNADRYLKMSNNFDFSENKLDEHFKEISKNRGT